MLAKRRTQSETGFTSDPMSSSSNRQNHMIRSRNFAPHPEIGAKFLDLIMWFCLLLLELMGSLVKPVSLCVRLFANMLAGHLVLAALVAMIPIGVGIHWAAT